VFRALGIGLAASVLGMLAATDAAAQSLFGVRPGDTKATAMQVMGSGAHAIRVSGLPGKEIIERGSDIAETCRGVVTSVQQKIGTTLHDYAAGVRGEERQYGPGRTIVQNSRSPAGEYSSVVTIWKLPVGSHAISFWRMGDQEAEVQISYGMPDPCANP
jgi:hypothetical protein